jgi:hypothetical protein
MIIAQNTNYLLFDFVLENKPNNEQIALCSKSQAKLLKHYYCHLGLYLWELYLFTSIGPLSCVHSSVFLHGTT